MFFKHLQQNKFTVFSKMLRYKCGIVSHKNNRWRHMSYCLLTMSLIKFIYQFIQNLISNNTNSIWDCYININFLNVFIMSEWNCEKTLVEDI